jgi:hypothetical protein
MKLILFVLSFWSSSFCFISRFSCYVLFSWCQILMVAIWGVVKMVIATMVRCSFSYFGHYFLKNVIVCPFFLVVYVIFMELQVWNIVMFHHLCEWEKTIHESTSGKYHFVLSLVWVEEKPFANLHVCNIIFL